jgi:hypothetical protein
MAHSRYPNAPLIIVETGEQAAGGLQPQFFHGMMTDLPARFPQIKAILYFDAPGLAPNHWALTPDGVRAFAKMAADPYFRPMP